MLKKMDRLYEEAAEQWCHFAHRDSMWPVKGEYRCRTCLRTYPVPWANTSAGQMAIRRDQRSLMAKAASA